MGIDVSCVLMVNLYRIKLLEELSYGGKYLLNDMDIKKVCELVNLRSLKLNNCKLVSSEGLYMLGQLMLLEELDVCKCNKLSGIVLRFWSERFNLSRLSLSGCVIKDFDVGWDVCDGLKNMIMLRDLDLSNCEWIDSSCVKIICEMIELERLSFGRCNGVTDYGIREIGEKLIKLYYLNLGWCANVSEKGISLLKELVELKELDLTCINVSNENLKMFSTKFKKLRRLNLQYSCVNDEGIRWLSELEELEDLNLKKTNVSGVAFESGFMKLRELDLSLCDLVYRKMMGGIIGEFTNDKGVRVDMSVCMDVGEKHVIMDGLKNVKYLKLSINVMDDSILEKLVELNGLDELDFSWYVFDSIDGLKMLGNITSLRKLNLKYCLGICGNEGIEHLSKLTLLEELQLSSNEVDEKYVKKILSKLKNLCGLCVSE